MNSIFTNLMIDELLKDISKAQHIIIYGCGEFGTILYDILIQEGIHIDYFIVSRKEENEKDKIVKGKKVYSIDEKKNELIHDSFMTIIATGSSAEKQIQRILLKSKVENFICLSQYKGSPINKYLGKSSDEYISNIQMWSNESFNCQKSKREKNKISFVLGNQSPRAYKIISSLIQAGYTSEVYIQKLAAEYNNIDLFLNLPNTVIKKYGTIEELMYCLICANPQCIYYFTDWGEYDELFVMLQQKQLFSPIIIDIYDTFNGMYKISSTDQALKHMLERYCIEHCDGFSTREYVYIYLKQQLNFNIQEDKLLPYKDYFPLSESVSKTGNAYELTFCYAGGIPTERESPDSLLACFLEFAQLCKENNCHFHVYPSKWLENAFVDYIELDKKNDYFHFHKPLPFNKLIEEIAQYDYGVMPVRRYNDSSYFGEYTKSKFTYAAANKYFDYLQAGLPIIAGTLITLAEEFEQKNILIKWAIEDYDFDELRRRKREMRENVLKVREEYSMEAHINELSDFIRSR